MQEQGNCGNELIQRMDDVHRRLSAGQRELLDLIAEGDRQQVWRHSGARDMAHWVCMRYGVSQWKARRWIAAAHALRELPRISEAFSSGEVAVDKVVELTRFATPETEGGLITWAQGVSGACIRRKGDLAQRHRIEEVRAAEQERTVDWYYYDDGRRFHMELDVSGSDGARIVKAVDRAAGRLPVLPGQERNTGARRADAAVALCSASLSADPDADRATVVVHATIDRLLSMEAGAEIEDGPVIHPETARRLLCDARVQDVLEDRDGEPLRLGRARREPSAGMYRLLKHRDEGCTFPGCGTRAFNQAHHIVWWERGGATDMDNLTLVCFFHHKLVHEYGWKVERVPDEGLRWFRPNGIRYRAGPGPPNERVFDEPIVFQAIAG